ncbi:UDP-glucosyltransferase 2-like isoform X2 [Schistocerca americana]|uniref:UDP-glucosyltransferase 2-like isoform X2 n=1 Tax=Schistocerca americana TaxID=7009 RepID=UPI001F4FE548|nr:UDP-glucosyltransferase 2-like isoform X2 [Schistocerca americana]
MRAWFVAFSVVAGLLLADDGQAANILAPIWFPGLSHFLMFRPLFEELAARGHNVTVLGHHPPKTPIKNYNFISLQGRFPQLHNNMTMDFVKALQPPLKGLVLLKSFTKGMCLETLDMPEVRQLATSGGHYDVVISEFFHVDCLAAFAHKFGAPLVGITSSNALPTVHDRVGNPEHPAYTEQYDLSLKAPFNFWERVYGTVMHQAFRILDWWATDARVDSKVREVFGEDTPPLEHVFRNTSLVLVNSHWSMDQPLPTVPAFVEVGGLHLEEPKPLPDDIQKFLDDSPHGVIYFSLGSMVRVETFDPEKFKAIVDAFASVPQRVLWKADPANLPGLPPNVRAQKWIPQNDVLNHPNVRLFISHGGLLGAQEAVAAGVPTLTLPLFSDQFVNSARAVAAGSGLQLLYDDIDDRSFREALQRLLNDSRFRERAKHRSQLFRDRPRPPLEEAVYWVEYVIRHQGAPHLRSAAMDLAWYQYLLIDVAAFVLAGSCCVISVLYLFSKLVLRVLLRGQEKNVKLKPT